MATINSLLKKIESVKLREAIPTLIKDTEDDLIELNTSQLYSGVDSKENQLKPYSNVTIEYKKSVNAPYDRTTLRDTGSFYRAWTIEVSNNEITFDSDDSKTPELVEKYGNDIFGLTKENKKKYSLDILYDRVKKYITEKTGIGFN